MQSYKWSNNPNLTNTTLQVGDISLISRAGTSYKVDIQQTINNAALLKTNNLSDIPNKATARTNLSVYSQSEIDNLAIDCGTF